MEINVLTIIIGITSVVSIMAFNNRSLMENLLFSPYKVKREQDYIPVLGHILIHADWAHLLFNMMSLYFLGSGFLSFTEASGFTESGKFIEISDGLFALYGTQLGTLHFLAIYLVGSLFATLIPYARNQDNPSYRSLGASGGVSAIIFASILWNPTLPLNLMFIPIDIPAYIFGPLYLLYEFYMDKRGGTGIAHDAHIGGAIFGVIYVLIINIDKGKDFISNFI